MKAFFATTLAGYDIGRVPRFETTSAAVYGRLTRAKRGLYRGVMGVKATVNEKRDRANLPPALYFSNLGAKCSFLGRHCL
jgi:hypothetical protein